MKNRKQAVMKANEYKSRIHKYGIKKPRKQVNWRLEVVKINEAFQHLTSKKSKDEFAVKHWKEQSKNNNLITKSLDCMGLDYSNDQEKTENKRKEHELKKANSKKAQNLALELAAHIDAIGCEKSKKENG